MKKTVLNSIHRDLKGRLVEFGGYEMPVQYTSIVDEHNCVRNRAGLFDLCHMGRFEIRGPKAVDATNAVISNNVAKMKTGQIRYSLLLNDSGGVRDDILVYRMPETVLLVVNASNRDKILDWFADRLPSDGAEFVDRSDELAMIALQGPNAESILSPLVETTWVQDLPALAYYSISDARVAVAGSTYEGWISRTGYTGENGFELYVPAERACDLWTALTEHAGDRLQPCGLGARDTLRLEAGMPLYGHELDEETNPLEANLRFAVKLKKADGFIGCEALQKIKAEGTKRRLSGFTVEGKRVARQGMGVFHGDQQVGVVTSGAPSPTLGKNIAVAFLDQSLPEDASLEVDVRGNRAALAPHPMPFYSRTRGQ